jgi:hypothetical protein
LEEKLMEFKKLASLTVAAALCAAPCFGARGQGENEDSQDSSACSALPNAAALKTALVTATNAEGSGLNMNMWATVVNRDGIVCAAERNGPVAASSQHRRPMGPTHSAWILRQSVEGMALP